MSIYDGNDTCIYNLSERMFVLCNKKRDTKFRQDSYIGDFMALMFRLSSSVYELFPLYFNYLVALIFEK